MIARLRQCQPNEMWLIGILFALILMLAAVAATNYQARVDLRTSLIRQCGDTKELNTKPTIRAFRALLETQRIRGDDDFRNELSTLEAATRIDCEYLVRKDGLLWP